MGDEGSYLPKWQAVVFMNLKNNRDLVWKAITNFVWQLGRYEPSPHSTEELHELGNAHLFTCISPRPKGPRSPPRLAELQSENFSARSSKAASPDTIWSR